tara:strand:- start:106 stop:651 length:546 start_codon:yes stop_codon:yes gene_type:complete
MLIDSNTSALLMIDMQEKLLPQIMDSRSIVDGCHWLLRLAKALSIPVLVSEQYPKGLKGTVPQLQELIEDFPIFKKTYFSCVHEEQFSTSIKAINRQQIILMGIETHVCVFQTAIDLKNQGYDVFVVGDVVSSRKETDHAFALQRMQQHGIEIVTKEMIFFEWVRKAGTLEFKTLSQHFLK